MSLKWQTKLDILQRIDEDFAKVKESEFQRYLRNMNMSLDDFNKWIDNYINLIDYPIGTKETNQIRCTTQRDL